MCTLLYYYNLSHTHSQHSSVCNIIMLKAFQLACDNEILSSTERVHYNIARPTAARELPILERVHDIVVSVCVHDIACSRSETEHYSF